MTGRVMEATEKDPILERLEEEIAWYDANSRRNQKAFRSTKITVIIAAALIPFLSATQLPHLHWVVGGLGVLITVLEGLLQLNQSQQNWITYRSTCEALKHEKYIFLGQASPYSEVANPRACLAERVESLVSQEHAKWSSSRQQVKSTDQDKA